MYIDIPDEPSSNYYTKRFMGSWAVFHPEYSCNHPKWGMGLLYPNQKEAERVVQKLSQRALRAG